MFLCTVPKTMVKGIHEERYMVQKTKIQKNLKKEI